MRYKEAHRPTQTITLTFKDANEIRRGSNVRMMGVEVGYVDGIQIVGDRVRVTLSPERDMPVIPDGSLATIEFTGLVGSKSIEIAPPMGKTQALARGRQPSVEVQEPIRIRDAISSNVEIANALKDGAQSFSDMFGRQEQVEALVRNIGKAKRGSGIAAERLHNGIRRLNELDGTYRRSRDDVLRAHHNMVSVSEDLARILDRETFVASVHPVLTYMAAFFEESAMRMERLSGVDRLYPTAQKRIERVHKRIPLPETLAFTEKVTQTSITWEERLARASQQLDRAESTVRRSLLPGPIEAFRQGVQAFGRMMAQWAQR